MEPKLFGKWSYDGVKCDDISLAGYLQVKTVRQQVFVPYTAGRYQQRRFKKVQCPASLRPAAWVSQWTTAAATALSRACRLMCTASKSTRPTWLSSLVAPRSSRTGG